MITRYSLPAAFAFACAALGLGACAQDPRLGETTWQVTAVYTAPGEPAAVPEPAAGLAVLSFGETSITGFSGCGPIQAAVTFADAAGHRAAPGLAESMELSEVGLADPPEDCVGAARHVHEQLERVFTPGPFRLEHLGATELVLTQDRGKVDAPAIRLAAS